jgi:hypothetical protein
MSTNSTVITAQAPAPATNGPGHLQVLTLVVAAAAAVTSVFAIVTDDVGSGPAPGFVREDSVTNEPAAPLETPMWVAIDRNVDDCRRPILPGRLACR